jgi:hypothetical protein
VTTGTATHHPNMVRQDSCMTLPTMGWAHNPGLDFQDRTSHQGPRPRGLGSRPPAPRPAKATDDPRVSTCSLIVTTMLLVEQETMTKATTSSRRTGQRVNHHCANSAVTTDTVASCHTTPRCGHKTMTSTTPGRALTPGQDDLPCKPSLLVSHPSGS